MESHQCNELGGRRWILLRQLGSQSPKLRQFGSQSQKSLAWKSLVPTGVWSPEPTLHLFHRHLGLFTQSLCPGDNSALHFTLSDCLLSTQRT